VLGIGIPQATAVADCAAAREHYLQESGRSVPVIADGEKRATNNRLTGGWLAN
jgi:hypothetical protein